jgi:hypothetical protein
MKKKIEAKHREEKEALRADFDSRLDEARMEGQNRRAERS